MTRYPYIPELYYDQIEKAVKEIFRPILRIRISNNGQISFPFQALIDSGADINLFPMNIASEIGIVLEKDKPRKIYGIGNSFTIVYPAKVILWIGIKKYETVVNFSLEQQLPLLGRNGFFNLLKSVKFDEKNKFLYIEE